MTRKEASNPQRSKTDLGLIVWIAGALVTVFIVTAIVFSWAAVHAAGEGRFLAPWQKTLVLQMAQFPGMVRDAFAELGSSAFGAPARGMLVARKERERPEWVRHFPAAEDTGYLLFSGVDRNAHHSVVKLLRIRDGAVIATWDPDWQAVYKPLTSKHLASKGSWHTGRALHPLLLDSGDIVFDTPYNGLARMGPCSREPQWVLNESAHHSIDLDGDGTLWVPSVSTKGFAKNPWMLSRIRDDAIARISLDGKLLEKQSVTEILRRNGLEPLLVGTWGMTPQGDPIHLNEIRVAGRDGPYWKRGDLLLSARHLSTVFLYRPSAGKIIWHRMGPWLNQHSVDFVDDHRISVLDNNVLGGAPLEQPFLVPGDTNRVFIYDFANGELSQPYAGLLAAARPVTPFEGRARVLPDGGLFIEESNYGRILRFTKDRLLWSFVNDYDEDHVGILNWSRYLTAEEARPAVEALAARRCPST
jgi:hypothetical protein